MSGVKIFVINLAKNPERMAYVRQQLDELNAPFERIEAVYGEDLTKAEWRQKVNAFRFWCAMGYWPSRGVVGCALSHCSVYQKMVQGNCACACVLEDDVSISPDFLEALARIEKWINPVLPQVVMLSALGENPRACSEIVPITGALSADGYVITLPAARTLLKANYPVVTVADFWARWVRRDLITLWRDYPITVKQNTEMFCGSDIRQHTIPISKLPTLTYIGHFVKRMIGITVDQLIWMLLRR